MEKKLPEDNLEAFFRKQLRKRSDEPHADGWDTPDDGVWDKIAPVIQPNTDGGQVLYIKWWAAAAAVAFVILFWQVYSCNQNLATIAQQVEQNSKLIESIDNQTTTKKEEIINPEENIDIIEENTAESNKNITELAINKGKEINNKAIKTQKDINNQPLTKTSNVINQQANNPIKTITTNESSVVDSKINSDYFTPPLSNYIDKIELKKQQYLPISSSKDQNNDSVIVFNKNKNVIPNQAKPTENKTNNKIAFLTVINKALLTPTAVLPPLKPLVFPENTVSFRPQIYLTVRTIFNSSSRTLRSQEGGLARIRRLREQEEESNHTTFGGAIGYQFHKNWSVETGVQQGHSTIHSLHIATFNFQRDLERPNDSNNDLLESQYALSLSTSYGDVSTDVTLTRPQSTMIRDGRIIEIGVETTQEINYIDIPLVAKYQQHIGKFHYGLKGGLSMRLIGESQVAVERVRLSQAIDILTPQLRRRITQALDKKPNSSLNYVLGASFEYALIDNLRLAVEPTFTRSFKPVFEKGNVETYAQTASLQVGLNYYF